jgi:hypothetical protein
MTTLRQQLDNITTTIKIVCTEGKRKRGVDFERVLYNRLIKQENKLENLSREMEELKRSK